MEHNAFKAGRGLSVASESEAQTSKISPPVGRMSNRRRRNNVARMALYDNLLASAHGQVEREWVPSDMFDAVVDPFVLAPTCLTVSSALTDQSSASAVVLQDDPSVVVAVYNRTTLQLLSLKRET